MTPNTPAGGAVAFERPTLRARMKDDLVPRFREFFPDCEMDAEWQSFLERIQGQEVTLVFTAGDAFEQVNDNYWLPDCMWDELEALTRGEGK